MTHEPNDTSKNGDFECTPLLDSIDSPANLRKLSLEQLGNLADEIRRKVILTASVNGGHLAAHLGVVELTLAIHHVFDTPRDLLVWDVGHQCYPHKLVTGRRDELHTIRLRGGLSGYPRREESPYDTFGVGHSSTSISAALGMAIARDRRGEDHRVIAVIGDGAMTAGMAFEALSHAGHVGTDLMVVLNDNNMSISPSVGALSAHFSKLITGGLYTRAREEVGSFMRRMLGPEITKAAERLEHSVKGFLMPATLFESLGFRYVGPVDGHDLPTLVECFKNLKQGHGPVFFHCVTQKGKGYSYAEEDPQRYHGVRAFDIETGEFRSSAPASSVPSTFTDYFAEALIEAGKRDPNVVAITAAMPANTGLSRFGKHFPDRVFDVGICEQHAVTLAAGLATQGLRPVCAIYSTFFQRAYDQILHDVCLQNLPVVLAIDRAGAVGPDSPTHQGAFDLSFLLHAPNMTCLAARDGVDLQAMLHWALMQPGPVAVRYARSKADAIGSTEGRDITRGEILREGTDAMILGLGPCLAYCLDAADTLAKRGMSVGVADARFAKPLDAGLLDGIKHLPILTVEENAVQGGFGTAVLEHFAQTCGLAGIRIRNVGFPDAFMEHGTRDEQLAEAGLDVEGIAGQVRVLLEQAHAPAK